MPAAALLACWFFSGKASDVVPQVSEIEIHKLETERKLLFDKTSARPGSGFTTLSSYKDGNEPAYHEIIFPIGRSGRAVLLSQLIRTNTGSGSHTVTKWRARGRRFEKVWQVALHASVKSSASGHFCRGHGPRISPQFRPVTAWSLAREDLERKAPFALYTLGIHGDISLQAFSEVFDAENNRVDMAALPWPQKKLPGGVTEDLLDQARFIVLPSEIKLMKQGSAVGG